MRRIAFGRTLAALSSAVVVLWAFDGTRADAPPDLELNPVTGAIEAVQASPLDGGLVRHVEDDTQTGEVIQTLVSAEPAADSRIAIKESGESWAVWEDSEARAIRYAYRDVATKIWTAEGTLSAPGELAHGPRIAHSGSATFVAYAIEQGTSTAIAVTDIIDSPEPFPPSIVLVTRSFSANPELDLRAEAGQVWISWVEDGSSVGWTERDATTGLWSAPRSIPLAGTSVKAVRQTIRDRVLAP